MTQCHWQQWQLGVVSLSLFIMIPPKLQFTFTFAASRPGQELEENRTMGQGYFFSLHDELKLAS
jgi:hypothetical protein